MLKIPFFTRPHWFLNLFMLLFVSSGLQAQNDLRYYLRAAFNSSPVIKEGVNSIELRNLDRSLTKAQYDLPQVSFTANYLFAPYFGSGKVITTAPDSQAIGYDASVTNGGLYSAQINITKNLFNSGIVEAYNSQTSQQIKSSQNNIELVKHALERDITEQYLNCYQAQKLFQLSIALTDTLNRQMNITKGLMLQGLARETDYLLLKVELAGQHTASDEALNAFRSSLYQLNTACGLKDTSLVQLMNTELIRTDYTGESKFLQQYSLDSSLVSIQQQVLETKYLPQLSVFANAGLNAVELTGIQRKFGMSAGFNFSLPIYDGSQKSITRQQSEISLRTITYQKDNESILIQNKIAETSSQIALQQRSMQTISSQLKDYHQIIKLSHSELLHGQLSMVEFITILKNFLELKKNEIQASTAYQQAVNQFNYWRW